MNTKIWRNRPFYRVIRGLFCFCLLAPMGLALAGCTGGEPPVTNQIDEAAVKAEAKQEAEAAITEENAEAALKDLEKEIEGDLAE